MKAQPEPERAADAPPSGLKGTPWLQRSVALVFPLILLGVMGAGPPTPAFSPASSITVCHAGPPHCDYQTIQTALDAATAGDTVRVEPGTYTGQLTLKSGVALESSGGPAVTIISATQAPIVTANAVISATLRGLSISGQGVLTGTVAIDLADSEVSLYDCMIGGLRGKDGVPAAPDGESATAIRSGGASKLSLSGVIIQDIRGGDSLSPIGSTSASGGDATGIAATGGGRITLSGTSIRQLTGGAGGHYYIAYSCPGKGGAATAIRANGDIDLAISDCQVTDLTGGAPCSAAAAYCEYGAGATVGIQATGGTVVVRESKFEGFHAQPAYQSGMNYGIYTAFTHGTHLERNNLTSFSASDYMGDRYSAGGSQATVPESPYCEPPPGTVIAIASESDSALVAADNSLSNLSASPWGGDAVGILVHGVAEVGLSRNRARGISSGHAGSRASGFRLEQVKSARIDTNALTGIHGGPGLEYSVYFYWGYQGGSAAGIELTEVTTATVANNVVQAVSGGPGAASRDGGDATGFLATGSSARIWNNSFYQTVAGRGGDGSPWQQPDLPPGLPGRAVGLKLQHSGTGMISAANNVLVQQGIGISSELPAPPVLAHNDLWGNKADYEGVIPGASDLHVAPGFANPEGEDLHLRAGSDLIDAGTNEGVPPTDMDGERRPLDGDYDGSAVADIGADEYWHGLLGSKTVDRSSATAGDILTYRITLTTAGAGLELPGVRITDTLPSQVTYILGSMSATSGTWSDAGGTITWTGTVSNAAPVTLTFKVRMGEAAGPLVIVNRAVLDDRVGVMRTEQAVTLVDALPYYFPFVSKSQ